MDWGLGKGDVRQEVIGRGGSMRCRRQWKFSWWGVGITRIGGDGASRTAKLESSKDTRGEELRRRWTR